MNHKIAGQVEHSYLKCALKVETAYKDVVNMYTLIGKNENRMLTNLFTS